MQFRGLLIAVLALVVAGGLVFWSNKAKQAESKKPPADASPKLLTLAEADIQQIEISRKGGEVTTLKRVGDNWEITSPASFKADKDSVTSLLSTVSSLASDKLVEDKPVNLADFGLNEPSLVLTVNKKDGKPVKLFVGDDTPTSSGAFVKLDGDTKVYTIASWTKSSIDKPAKDLRDKRLLIFDTEKLVRVELNARKSVTEFARNNQNEWQILKPKPYRADGLQVEEIIRKLKDAKLDTSISDEDAKKAAAGFASGTIIAIATITDNAGSQKLEVRKAAKDDKYFAKSSAIEGVHSVTSDTGTGLDKSTDDFRNKKVFDFGFSDPIKVDYKDASRTLTLAKSGDKWVNGVKEQDSVSVQAFIDKLRDLQAVKFSEGVLPAAISVTVVSNEGKRTEKVYVGQKGQVWFAQRENEPALYELAAGVADALQKAAADVKEPPPPAKDAGKEAKKK